MLSPARRSVSRWRLWLSLAFLALVGGVWYVHSRGGWLNILRLPPVLDASTPSVQYGYTLAKIARTDEANFAAPSPSLPMVAYLLIKPPNFPACIQQSQMLDGLHVYTTAKGVTDPIKQASGQTSSGDVTSLGWLIVGDDSGPAYLRIDIPGGYSGDSKFLNVTLVTNDGPFPRWRIARLPPMRQVIPDTPTVTDTITKNGISVSVHAWRYQGMIFVQTRPILPPQSHQWGLTEEDQWMQWEPYNTSQGQSDAGDRPIQSRGGVFTAPDEKKYGGGLITNQIAAPYRSASRYVRADMQFHQFETDDESVTFHNVEVKQTEDHRDNEYYLRVLNPQTITTPSGIKVTLPAQGLSAPTYGLFCLIARLSIEPFGSGCVLPDSQLVKTFQKPVQVELDFPTPMRASEWTAEDGPAHDYTIIGGQPKVGRNQTFTVIIRQRVDIQTIPMSFTVPVSDTPPAGFH